MSQATKQFVAKCERFWKEADTDGNNCLTVGELKKVICKVSTVEVSDADIAEMFEDLDDNNDKKLSFEEFSDVFKKKNPKQVQKSELKEAFDGMDKDGSGRLSTEEIRQQYAKLEIPISDEAFEKTVAKADADGDGKISYQEFLTLLG